MKRNEQANKRKQIRKTVVWQREGTANEFTHSTQCKFRSACGRQSNKNIAKEKHIRSSSKCDENDGYDDGNIDGSQRWKQQ